MAAAAWGGVVIVLLADLFAESRLPMIWKVLWLPVLLGLPLVGGVFYGAVGLIRGLMKARQSKV